MKSLFRFICYLSVTLIGALFSSCEYTTPMNNPAAYLADYRAQPGEIGGTTTEFLPDTEEKGYWDGDGVDGKGLIKINIGDQKAYFYKGDQLVGQTPISTGKEGKLTPRGAYKVTQKSVDHRSSLYGVIKDDITGEIVNDDAKTGRDVPRTGQTFVNAPMLNFLRFNGAIGMHTGYLPGYAASHGCVRLPDNMAQHFFQNSSLGTPVIVE
jgi:lipoprotein-anchoring transpeptidase ErfK/SrfK